MAEEIITHIGEIKIIKATTTGPASYSSGGFTLRISMAKEIKEVLKATNDGGYKVEEGEITKSGNQLTIPVRYYDYDAAADGSAIEVADATDLSGVNFEVIVLAV